MIPFSYFLLTFSFDLSLSTHLLFDDKICVISPIRGNSFMLNTLVYFLLFKKYIDRPPSRRSVSLVGNVYGVPTLYRVYQFPVVPPFYSVPVLFIPTVTIFNPSLSTALSLVYSGTFGDISETVNETHLVFGDPQKTSLFIVLELLTNFLGKTGGTSLVWPSPLYPLLSARVGVTGTLLSVTTEVGPATVTSTVPPV